MPDDASYHRTTNKEDDMQIINIIGGGLRIMQDKRYWFVAGRMMHVDLCSSGIIWHQNIGGGLANMPVEIVFESLEG